MELLETSIETFPAEHPAIHGRMLLERARVALSLHHESPAAVHFRHPTDEQEARVRFAAPDPRSMHTLDREKFAEEGAIVMAGILLQHYESLRITRVVPRGSRVDYYLGDGSGDEAAIMEVGGTMLQSVETILQQKRRQMAASPFQSGVLKKPGFIAVTRFAAEAVSVLEVTP